MEIQKRLVDYFEAVGAVLRGDAKKAMIFPNPADIGGTREEILSAFLQSHLPAWCNIERGGYLFNWEGNESGQLDIIISSGYAPKFVPFPENGKVVREVEGVLGVTSVKSKLTKATVQQALNEFAEIPQMRTNNSHVNPLLSNYKIENFIFLHVYASESEDMNTIFQYIHEFYESNSTIPLNRRSDLIHANSKGVIFKAKSGLRYGNEQLEESRYYHMDTKANFFGLSYAIDEVRRRVALLPQVNFQISDLPKFLFEAHGPGQGDWQLYALARPPLTPATS